MPGYERNPKLPPESHAEILGHCAASSGPWFPAEYARAVGIARDRLDEPILDLMRMNLIEVVDWVRGRGQGFGLTELGRHKVAGPGRLPAHAPRIEPATLPASRHPGRLTTFEWGEIARSVLESPQPAVVAPALALACVLVFVIGLTSAANAGTTTTYLNSSDLPVLLKIGAAHGPLMLQGEWWRLITCNFVHIGILHLLLNGLALLMAGAVAEAMWRRVRFELIFAASALAGSAFTMAMRPEAVLAGASGGIWGIQMAVVAWLISYARHLPGDWVRATGSRLGFAILINAAASAIPGIAWQAHLAGGIAGFIVAICANSIRTGAGWRGWIAGAVLLLALVTAVLGFRRAVQTNPNWAALRLVQDLEAIQRANAAAVLVPHDRVLALQRDSVFAAVDGQRKKIDAVQQMALKLKADADHAEALWAKVIPRDEAFAESVRNVRDYFRNVSAYASEVHAACAGESPVVALKDLGDRVKELSQKFQAIQVSRVKP